MEKCYGAQFSTEPNNFPYPTKAQAWNSTDECKDAYEEFLIECQNLGSEPAMYWLFIGEPVGDEEDLGYPDQCDFFIEPDENNSLMAIIRLG